MCCNLASAASPARIASGTTSSLRRFRARFSFLAHISDVPLAANWNGLLYVQGTQDNVPSTCARRGLGLLIPASPSVRFVQGRAKRPSVVVSSSLRLSSGGFPCPFLPEREAGFSLGYVASTLPQVTPDTVRHHLFGGPAVLAAPYDPHGNII